MPFPRTGTAFLHQFPLCARGIERVNTHRCTHGCRETGQNKTKQEENRSLHDKGDLLHAGALSNKDPNKTHAHTPIQNRNTQKNKQTTQPTKQVDEGITEERGKEKAHEQGKKNNRVLVTETPSSGTQEPQRHKPATVGRQDASNCRAAIFSFTVEGG